MSQSSGILLVGLFRTLQHIFSQERGFILGCPMLTSVFAIESHMFKEVKFGLAVG